jgi:invasion protein IalB
MIDLWKAPGRLATAAVAFGVAMAGAAGAQESDASGDAQEAAAPTPVANGARIGAWTVTCEAVAVGQTACVLSQRLVRSADNAFLAELLAFRSADGARTFLAARVPNGVFFPSGFAVRPEDSETQREFVWQSCSRDLCEALLEVEPQTLAELEGAGALLAGYRPALTAEPLVFRLSLEGAGDGLDALDAAR